MLDYASVTVAPVDTEALGAERQRDVPAGLVASPEIYDERLLLRSPHLIEFPLFALFVEQHEVSGFTWLLAPFVVQVKLS